jgi:hypothetical protein
MLSVAGARHATPRFVNARPYRFEVFLVDRMIALQAIASHAAPISGACACMYSPVC